MFDKDSVAFNDFCAAAIYVRHMLLRLRDGPFDMQGGGWDFYEKIVCFPTGAKKVKYLQRS